MCRSIFCRLDNIRLGNTLLMFETEAEQEGITRDQVGAELLAAAGIPD
jgi:hypothetical protein